MSDQDKGGIAFIDGEYQPIGEARIPLLDWGFLRSDANQDTVSVWKGLFFRLEDHLDRFEHGLIVILQPQIRMTQRPCDHLLMKGFSKQRYKFRSQAAED